MMFGEKPREKPALSWLWVAAWVLFVYLAIPFARLVQGVIRGWGLQNLFLWITWLSFALAAGWIARAIFRKQWAGNAAQLAILAGIGALFAWLTWSLRGNPEEAFHFVEYGVLSLLLFRAFSHHLREFGIYPVVMLTGAAVGIGDEIIQWVVPGRVFDFRDIMINAGAGVLVQLALALGIRPALVHGAWSWRGCQFICRAAMVNLVLLLFCVSNTYRLKEWYTRWIPAAAAIAEVTAEYGHRITHPDIGVFFSRLTPDALLAEDRRRGMEVGAAISQARTDRQYGRFLADTPAWRDPLAVEARMHVFRRDFHANAALRERDPDQARLHANIAVRENAILNTFFAYTMAASIFPWPADRARRLQALSQGGAPCVSAVSRHLITGLTQKQWTALLLLLLAGAAMMERVSAHHLRGLNPLK